MPPTPHPLQVEVPAALPTSANKAKRHLANPGYVPHGANEDSDRIKTKCCVSVQYSVDTRNNITVTVHAVPMRYIMLLGIKNIYLSMDAA